MQRYVVCQFKNESERNIYARKLGYYHKGNSVVQCFLKLEFANVLFTRGKTFTCVGMCICRPVLMRVCLHVFIYKHVYIYIFMYKCTFAYIYTLIILSILMNLNPENY